MILKIAASLNLLFIASGFVNVSAQATVKPVQKIEYTIPSSYKLEIPEKDHLTGYLGERYKINLEQRLLKVDEEGLLEGFYSRPGKQRWIGEHIGKYLETAANTWLNTKDPRLKEQMDRMFTRLLENQKEDGYLGTYLPENYWTAWDVWVHKYNIYGLLAYYGATNDSKALNAAIKIGDLLCKNFGTGAGQKNILKSGSHVGMAATSVIDPMLDLYMWTGDKKYYDFANYVISAYDFEGGPAIVSTLLKQQRVDKVANSKSYEMLSNILGLIKMYRLSGNADLLKVINYTFDDISTNRLFVTGTSSDHERFMDNQYLRADTAAHMGEGCVTTTWMQFNTQMFSITGDLKYYNEIEKTIYNHLLGAENPRNGCVSYYTPLIGEKPYRCAITCCASSVPRGIALIPYLNYGILQNAPTILMYEAANIKDQVTVAGKKLPVEFNIKSAFPEKGTATIDVKLAKASKFNLQLRKPEWAKNFTVKVNGKTAGTTSGQLAKIHRLWNNNDKITVAFEMPTVVLDGGKSYPNAFAFKRGPQVLAVDYSLNSSIDINKANLKYPATANYSLTDISNQLPKDWVKTLLFSANLPSAQSPDNKLVLVPYADASQTGGFTSVWIPSVGK